MTVFSAAALFTLPLLWCSPKWRWTMWVALAGMTIFAFVNIVYRRNFDSLMPLNAIMDVGNLHGMVLKAALATIRLTDLTLLIPITIFIVLWCSFFRSRVRNYILSRRVALQGTIFIILFWVLMQVGSTFVYAATRRNIIHQEDSPVGIVVAKFRGKLTERISYLLYNGMDVYLIWSLSDFSPSITLTVDDRQLIAKFLQNQVALDKDAAIKLTPAKGEVSERSNMLIIMIESFETWALDYKQAGKPMLGYLDTLISLPQTLYFPHLVSQVSSGHSSDGHLEVLTGLLPFRESAVVTDFANQSYPSLIKAYKAKHGSKAYEIIGDEASLWNQNLTYSGYGFDKLYSSIDVDPKHKSSWVTRDEYLSTYVCNFLKDVPTPFALMAVTLSLHTPYRSAVPYHDELKSLPIDPQSIHYLQVCRYDEDCIRDILNVLKERGIYDDTVIIITGDHSAHGLFDSVRPPQVANQEKFIPLIVLNSGFERYTYPQVAGQIDIYPTLLDILGLEDYPWRGLGLSLLRHNPEGATRRNFEIYGTLTPQETARQTTAWNVSELLIRSNYFSAEK
ncbi:MAG: LTA synthase family protein [Muribaculaceae bacterium]|nr:LTA synthase family protein [Muribaculaceae bacterium]